MNTIRAFALVAFMGLASACTNPYTGQLDPVATTAAVGAVVVGAGAVGYLAGQNNHHSHTHHHWNHRPHRPRVYHYHWNHNPRPHRHWHYNCGYNCLNRRF
jgi:hypothetical protein